MEHLDNFLDTLPVILDKIFATTQQIPAGTAIVAVAVVALLAYLIKVATKAATATLVLVIVVAIAFFAIPAIQNANLPDLSEYTAPLTEKGRELLDRTPDTLDKYLNPSSQSQQSKPSEQSQALYAKIDYDLLEQTDFENWSPAFTNFSSSDFKKGTLTPIKGSRTITFSPSEELIFTVSIHTDIKNLAINEDSLATFITALACARAANYGTPMQTDFTIIASSGYHLTDVASISILDDPASILKTAFSTEIILESGQVAGANITTNRYPSKCLILLSLGGYLDSWNRDMDISIYDTIGIVGPGKELATALLSHELCHCAFPWPDHLDRFEYEQLISLSSAAIATDFGQLIFDLAPS